MADKELDTRDALHEIAAEIERVKRETPEDTDTLKRLGKEHAKLVKSEVVATETKSGDDE